ncbi:subunit of heterotrimeric replication factor [Eremomyces bilateralis CBS 781.70]|uniref:Replication protein A subunit n=1 Tax=Eremomyces bilateralis CBS 781.70 TaxID=1392243 RepID=A0A6G1FYD0_9PEZI|nr:subunit of heterotrimeric replication factor [Eremomyces bilateralis CBS 781.70]KAF1810784.1 subunit of heterotrimeric replication factor [Eremomyces bilateralis CBS 781.70]
MRVRPPLLQISNASDRLLVTDLCPLVDEGSLRQGQLVRVLKHQLVISNATGAKFAMIEEMEVLAQYGTQEKIGNPRNISEILDSAKDAGAKPQPAGITGDNFYGAKPESKAQDIPQRSNNPRPGFGGGAHPHVLPIEGLSPYQNKWTIRVRCTHKSDIKTWHKQSGEGKLFSVNLLDEGGEIRATGFNAECDNLYDLFQEGMVYYISSPAKINIAKRQFTQINNEYEIVFERDTQVEKAEDQSNAPQVRYNFTPIGSLQDIAKDTTIDTIGVLKDVGELSQIVSKTTSKPYDKRELTLVDDSLHSVRLTIWGNQATNFDTMPESIIAFKGCKVSDFGGRSLSLLSSGSMTVSPDIDDAFRLKGWFDAQGKTDTFTTFQNMAGAGDMGGTRSNELKTIGQVKDEELGMHNEPAYFTVKATISYVKRENYCYAACKGDSCNRKVQEIEPGNWRCEWCEKSHDAPNYRYIISINVVDHTGSMWLTCFDEPGNVVMGMSANELHALGEEGNNTLVFEDANLKTLTFRCRAKTDTYQDQQRIRYQVNSAAPLNFPAESARLQALIKQYEGLPDLVKEAGDQSLFV